MLDQLEAQQLFDEISKAVKGLENAKAALVPLQGAPIEIVVSTEQVAVNAIEASLGHVRDVRLVRVSYLPEMIEKYGKIDLHTLFALYLLLLNKYGQSTSNLPGMVVSATFSSSDRVQGAIFDFAYFAGES